MNLIQSLQAKDNDKLIKYFLTAFGIILLILAFMLDDFPTLISGIEKIITHSGRLITDYVEVAGFGATFLNAGLLVLISMGIIQLSKTKMSGIAIAAVLLMGGFGMFGKNIVNIWGIILGVFLYAKYQGHPFSRYIFIAFFGTCLAPVTTELILWKADWQYIFLFSFLIGVVIGFLLPPISSKTLAVHQGYNLYNVGFAAGLIGTVIAAIMNSFGYEAAPRLIWYNQHNYFIIGFVYFLFILFIILGFLLDPKCIPHYRNVLKKSGRLVSDFVASDGLGVVLFNMGILGVTFTSYVLIVGGHLNGPTIGGILTVVGFAGFGKHLKNTLMITAGVVLGAIVNIWSINDPAVLLGALFGTSLAPIAGQFGLGYGVLAGFLHLSVVLSIGSYHGGLNLYNNGFSAGLVALFLIPVIETFYQRKKKGAD